MLIPSMLISQLVLRTFAYQNCHQIIPVVRQSSKTFSSFLNRLVPSISACQSGCQQSTMSDHDSGSEDGSGDFDDRPKASKSAQSRGGGALTRQQFVLESAKSDYEKRSLEDRRKNYRCGEGYYPLVKVLTWSEYAAIQKLPSSKLPTETYAANKRLNEKIGIFRGDITSLEIDCIVNAANRELRGGGGVDGAIHRAAGPDLKIESGSLAPCDTGDAKITYGYDLPAKYVIHTVGPIGEKPDLLRSCYEKSLERMQEKNLRTIAFPCISTGIYGYPNKKAAKVVLQTLREWLETDNNADKVDRIILCLFMREDIEIYHIMLMEFFPLKPGAHFVIQ